MSHSARPGRTLRGPPRSTATLAVAAWASDPRSTARSHRARSHQISLAPSPVGIKQTDSFMQGRGRRAEQGRLLTRGSLTRESASITGRSRDPQVEVLPTVSGSRPLTVEPAIDSSACLSGLGSLGWSRRSVTLGRSSKQGRTRTSSWPTRTPELRSGGLQCLGSRCLGSRRP
jgi:hypothetical protein